MAEASERARAAFVVAAAHIVEHDPAVAEVTRREFLLDVRLPRQQPVERVIELVDVGAGDAHTLAERRGTPQPRRREFRTRMDQPLDDHRQHQVARARALRRDQRVETEAPDHAQDRLDMAMRQRGLDREEFVRADERFVAQHATEGLDARRRPGGQIRDGALPYPARLTPGFAQQDRRRRGAVGDTLDIHGHKYSVLSYAVKRYFIYYMGTYAEPRTRASWPLPSSCGQNERIFRGNFGLGSNHVSPERRKDARKTPRKTARFVKSSWRRRLTRQISRTFLLVHVQ